MGLFSNLLETYDKCSSIAGIVPVDANGISDEKKAFLPLYHTTFKTNIQVTLDDKGNLLNLDRDQKDLTIIIPCTESSTSRSGKKISAHPLCDQLGYLDKNLNSVKFNNYIQQLENWKVDNIKLNSIYEYLTKNSLAEDIKNNNLLKDTEYNSIDNTFIKNIDKSGKDKDFVVEKLGIRFSVQIKDDLTPNVWQDSKLKDMWINHYGNFEETSNFDYLGQQLNQLAKTHPKNINSRTANAKLISCNDTSGLTFRGRFNTQDEAVQIDALASQKIHITLRWLINNCGYNIGSQVVVIWSVDSDTDQKISPFDNSFGLWSKVESDIADIGIEEVQNLVDIDYSKKVVNLLRGYGNKKWLSEHFRKVVIVIFDASTPGRIGVTFYQELPENEYLENIAKWHEESKWHLTGFKKGINEKRKEEEKPFKYIGCPSFNDIIKAVHGKPRALHDKSYITLKKKV
ncbi:MAG: type I-C CRISPR-associated protein Cas8c/Csd1, partial [Clostridia bacterium]|nr:type I-C CRISPR-associated protein Cas8c/Csd1 [Clostridia bacterium]